MDHIIRTEITEKLCCSRDPFYVEQFKRPIYSCKACEKVSDLPVVPEVFQKSCLSESTVSFTIVSKFDFSQPFYRQARMMVNWGVQISSDTLVRHCLQSSELLSPLYFELGELVKMAPYIQGDETRLKAGLIEPNGKKVFKSGYLWGLLDQSQNVYFEFTPKRNHAECAKVFDTFKGI